MLSFKWTLLNAKNKLTFYTTLLINFALEFFLRQAEDFFVRNPTYFLQPKMLFKIRVCSSCQQDFTNDCEGSDLCILLSK